VATVQATRGQAKLSAWDFFYALDMALACLISYWIMTFALLPIVDKPDALLGGMWATVATLFVFRNPGRGCDHPTDGPISFEPDPDVLNAAAVDLSFDRFEPCPQGSALRVMNFVRNQTGLLLKITSQIG
jgi:hypothetical protein